ncbi:ABC transporter ATP-binding protein [[Actinomadura] parvosata]|uniref:ABC transporter ATP-binding protein n=1 Tax=[Actinomadura] parvosata TaxID=1955412 RepID=UPI00406C7C87
MAAHVGELIRVKGLARLYGERVVLDGLDLEIAPGEFVALLGQSGSGKSTLLRALAGLDGDVAGTGLVEVPAQVSVVFQDARLLPWQRVLDNVILGLDGAAERGGAVERAGAVERGGAVGRGRAVGRAGAVERGRQSLAEVGLAGRERAWPNELSGGEQQRVALARSLVREPRLLLADEPFGALDALTRLKMHGLLRRLFEEHRPAVLLVTHDVDEAIALADRVLVLDHGRIAAEQRLDAARSAAEIRAELLRALGVGEVPPSRRDGRPHRDG